MEISKLVELVGVLKSLGVIKYRTQEIELELHPAVIEMTLFPVRQVSATKEDKEHTEVPELTYDQLLFQGVGGPPGDKKDKV